MGEARRKRVSVIDAPCPCGSGKPARRCCFNGRHWHKPATVLGLRALPPAFRAEKCYMKELGSCVGPISGEHLISESVIRVLMAGGEFSVSGLPWLDQGVEKILPVEAFRTNCLCAKHNSALSPLDHAAKFFFASLKSCLELNPSTRHAIVSGHDIERWLLKTAKAMAVSKNFARGGERLSGAFAQDAAVLDMLDAPDHWSGGTGLYCTMNAGDLAENNPRFQLQPATNNQGEIEALGLSILGLRFVLMLEPPNLDKHPFLRGARYRPGRIEVAYPSSSNWITMSWDDGRAHENLTVKFIRMASSAKRGEQLRPRRQ
jgi:hypothetical protein